MRIIRFIHLFVATWLAAGSSVASDGRPVVAVIDFENRATVRWWGSGVGEELAGMLSNELAALGSFRLVERDKLRAVLEEQNLAASGRVAAGTGPGIGRLTGAQYLITGTVTAYDEYSGGTGGGISFKGISLGGKQSRAYIAIDLRVIEANTGEVAYARTVGGTATSGGVAVGISRGGFGGSGPTRSARQPVSDPRRAHGGGGVPRVRDGGEGPLHPGISGQGTASAGSHPQQAPGSEPASVLVAAVIVRRRPPIRAAADAGPTARLPGVDAARWPALGERRGGTALGHVPAAEILRYRLSGSESGGASALLFSFAPEALRGPSVFLGFLYVGRRLDGLRDRADGAWAVGEEDARRSKAANSCASASRSPTQASAPGASINRLRVAR